MSRMINDLMDVSDLPIVGQRTYSFLVMIIGSFIILCTINIPLTVLIFAFIPFIVYFSMKQKIECIMLLWKQVETSEVNSNLENSLSGIRLQSLYSSEA